MELVTRLEEFEAPAEVVWWAREHATFGEAWDACPGARHRVWLGSVAGMPIESIAEAAAAAFFAVTEGVPDLEHLVSAVEAAVGAGDAAECAAIAERCERAASTPATYRDGPRHAAIATAAGHVCRAFEALRSAELAIEADRMVRARMLAATIAGGVQAFLPAEGGPATLLITAPATAERGLLVLAVASAAEALGALRAVGDESTPTLIDETVWDVLAPS